MEDELVINALRKALTHRQPAAGLIAHSDRGGQYVSDELRALLNDHHARQSMTGPPGGRADDPYDNAFAESFWTGPPGGRFKAEVLEGGAFLDLEDARTEIFDYIELYHNGTGHPANSATFIIGQQKPAYF